MAKDEGGAVDVAAEAAKSVGKRAGRPAVAPIIKLSKGRLRREQDAARGAVESRRGLHAGGKVTFPKYEKAWEVFLETENMAEVARRVGISVNTVSRLVNKGVPGLGWQPLRERLVKVRAAQQYQADYTLVRAHEATGDIIKAFKRKLFQRVAKMDPEEIKASSIAADVNALARLESFIMGGDDSRSSVTVTGREKYEGWTVEEIVAHINTGKVPVRHSTETSAVANAMKQRRAGEE